MYLFHRRFRLFFKDLASRVMYKFFFLFGTDIGIHSIIKVLNILDKYFQALLILRSLNASSQSTELSRLLSWSKSAQYKLNLEIGLLHFST